MSRTRRYKANILLLMFVMGSLVAPFSHYMFMLVSDAYQIGAHHAHELTVDPLGEHHVGVHHTDHKNVHLKSEPRGHIHCDYWGLFATFTATTTPVVQLGLPSELVAIVAEWAEEAPIATVAPAYRLRGPPLFLS